MERNEAAASKQPQWSQFHDSENFMFLASGEAILRLRPNFMVGLETPWVGTTSVQVWSALTQY